MTRFFRPLLVLCCLAGPVGAESEEVAKQIEAAELLLKAKDFAGALAGFDKVLEAEPGSMQGLRGRVEALLGAGQKKETLEALIVGVRKGEVRRAFPPADAAALMGMRSRLAELDPAHAELEVLLRKHADALAALGGKWLTKDPAAAEGALQRAMRLQPDHAAARDRLGRLQRARAGKTVSLFAGRNLNEWIWADPANWNVKEGLIEAEVMTGAMVIRSNKRFDGDQEVTAEFRLSRPSTDVPPIYGVMAAYEGDDASLFFGVSGHELVLTHSRSTTRQEPPRTLWSKALAALDPPLLTADWHRYALHLDGAVLRASLDGKPVASVTRPPERDGGYVALLVQGSSVQFRKVEATSR